MNSIAYKLTGICVAGLLMAACGGSSHRPLTDEEKEELATSYSETGIEEKTVAQLSGDTAWKDEIRRAFKAGRYDLAFNDSNHVHYAVASKAGIAPINSLSEAYNTRRPIVRIESCENYEIDHLTHSMPFLVPEAARLLDEIGESFRNKVEERYGTRDNRILVTSLLRSPHSVKRLRRVNRNAVDSSVHMFATTFDISYNSFHSNDSTKAVNAAALKNILAEVLLEKRLDDKCFVKYERKSPCFHVTVNSKKRKK